MCTPAPFPRTARRTREYYARYPGDEQGLARLVDHLTEHEVLLPDGDVLTPHRLRPLGAPLGMSYGFEHLHWLLDDAWAGDELHPAFPQAVQAAAGFADNVLLELVVVPSDLPVRVVHADLLRPKFYDLLK